MCRWLSSRRAVLIVLAFVVGAVGSVTSPSVSSAAVLDGALLASCTGHSEASASQTTAVNFAVLEPASNPRDEIVPLTSSPSPGRPPDNPTKFAYRYQVANTLAGPSQVSWQFQRSEAGDIAPGKTNPVFWVQSSIGAMLGAGI